MEDGHSCNLVFISAVFSLLFFWKEAIQGYKNGHPPYSRLKFLVELIYLHATPLKKDCKSVVNNVKFSNTNSVLSRMGV